MEREIFTSEVLEKFNKLAEEIEKTEGIIIQLARIQGKRRSFIAGRKDTGFLVPEEIQITENAGLLSYSNKKLAESEKEEIFSTFFCLFNQDFNFF